MPKHASLSPGRVILAAVLTIIMLGTFLLQLPWAQTTPVSALNCFFTATTAVCTTGRLVVPLEHFSWYGHSIILMLMQLGALGLITFSVFFLSLFTTLGLSTKSITGEAMELHHSNDPLRIAIFTIYFTLAAELFGFVCTWFILAPYYTSWTTCAWLSLCHAISSFCNAGILFIPLQSTVYSAPHAIALLGITGGLAFVGGLGFIVWRDVFTLLFTDRDQKRSHLLLHTRLVLITTGIIIALLTFCIFFLEYNPFTHNTNVSMGLLDALFNAISFRGPGFTTLAINSIRPATLLLIMLASFIGSSPGSAGSGIKVTTCALLFITIRATLLRNTTISTKGRTIPHDQIFKALAIFTLSVLWISITTFFLLMSEHGAEPFALIFEAVSAFTNLGLSCVGSYSLSLFGKYLLISSMIVGRIGSLTVLLALKKQSKYPELYYPEERIMMG
jgi:trk system potassium uptake protein TrkH